MEELIKAIEKRIKCQARELLIGLMADITLVNTRMIKSMGLVSLAGLMGGSMLGNG